MSLKTQNQERASFVLENIEKLKKSNYTEKVSSYILTNGLLPTLAFLKSKEDAKEEKDVYECVGKWLKSKFINADNKGKDEDIISYLVNKDSTTLRLATIEAMELANWMRRLVKKESGEKK